MGDAGLKFAIRGSRVRTSDAGVGSVLSGDVVQATGGARGSGASAVACRRRQRGDVDRAPGIVRRRLRHASTVDVRAGHDGVAWAGRAGSTGWAGKAGRVELMRKAFVPFVVVAAAMFA